MSTAVTVDHYHRFRDDDALMRELGVDSHRFSPSRTVRDREWERPAACQGAAGRRL
ncbi:family 1 glycosylhydrolase [Streptomyces graminofaciens]|uniref:family 1 glycosylhydrolase n=1 Tax=Streptomyces graminofaciens TaxID=68212 RepID=UPI00257318C0|nr:family 1 glycosylhydrolase [Streptomyces graminofaciens]